MPLLNFLRIKACLFSVLLMILVAACKPTEPLDVKISIDLNIFKTFVSFRFADSETGEWIGKSDGTVVRLSFDGSDADAVVSQTGDRLAEHTSVLGMLSVALDPYGPYKMPENPVIVSFTARADGYAPTKAAIMITATGTHVCMVSMRKTNLVGKNPQKYLLKPGEVAGSILPAGFRMITPDNLFLLDFPDSISFAGEGGTPASGQLTISAMRYSDLAETATGGTRVMRFSKSGITSPGILQPESIVDLSLQCSNSGPVTTLPGKPVSWRFPVSSHFSPGDSVPVWSFNAAQKIWESAGYAAIDTEDTSRFATARLSHFSLFASGRVIPTRLVSGDISFAFAGPFPSSSFPGEVIISDGATGEKIQAIPMMLFAGLSAQLTLDLPLGSSNILTVRSTDPDNEFTSEPASLLIAPDQSTFSGSFSLTPVKCRIAGTVTATFQSDFNRYPVQGILQVIDTESGNNLLSKSISITSATFSTTLSLMVHKNHPVTIRLIPATLSGDFRSIPEKITEPSPCIDNGSWNFSLDGNTCVIQSVVSVTVKGAIPAEPIPANVLLLRASDHRLIRKIAVNLASPLTTITVESAVPKNTPLLISIEPATTEQLFTPQPAEFLWNNPCSSSLNPEFSITPDYASLNGRIQFTFGQGVADEIPVRILTYTVKNDNLLSSSDFLVHRNNPVISIHEFTPAVPIYLKITRASSSIRFNPEPFKILIPDPSYTPDPWQVTLSPTELLPVHFLVSVVCPNGEILPTIQGYYRIPGDDWHEMNIISGNMTIAIELGLTYEVGMILAGSMMDTIFTVDKLENKLIFNLTPEECENLGWGK